ncbi:hypothetical protein M9Y10_006066 [Tritrichomonas musculus]|uniref:Uncharacterized protein n=1 Tax=Tritrichomonas musculus TaxID=1915356 RepID=A0ABR2JFZ9_9EUKA
MVTDSTFKNGLKALIYSESIKQCYANTFLNDGEFLKDCYISGFDCVIHKTNADKNLDFVSTCFFNYTSTGEIIHFESKYEQQPTLSISKCCFFNLVSDKIIVATSQCLISGSSFLNNTADSIISTSEFYFSLYNNNFSYNSNCIFRFSSQRDGKGTFSKITFAHNFGSNYLINFQNYPLISLAESTYINNSCQHSIIYIGTPLSSDAKFTIEKSYFVNNFEYQSSNNVSILEAKNNNLALFIINCQTNAVFPSKSLYPNCNLENNKESVYFSQDDVVAWNVPKFSNVSTPAPSEGFICAIIPNIPWPTQSPMATLTQSPTESPTESPTQSASQSPSDSPAYSPTQSATESPTPSDSPLPSISPSQSNSPSQIISPLPSETLTFSDLPFTEKSVKPKKKTGLIVGIVISLIAIIAIILCIIFCLKKKGKFCFKHNESLLMSSIDMLESNPPLLDSNPDELMSGKENVFSKTSHKNVFDYSLFI